jgi:hypothetical protein
MKFILKQNEKNIDMKKPRATTFLVKVVVRGLFCLEMFLSKIGLHTLKAASFGIHLGLIHYLL